MKTPREENFAKFIHINTVEGLNVKKLGYIWFLSSQNGNVGNIIQCAMDYAESAEELVQLFMGIIAIQREVIDLSLLQMMTNLSPSKFDKLELFGKFPNEDDMLEITTKYNEYIKDFEVRDMHETIGIVLVNDEFNNWPAIITIYFGLMLQVVA